MPLPMQFISHVIPTKWYYSIVLSRHGKRFGFYEYLERDLHPNGNDIDFIDHPSLKNLKCICNENHPGHDTQRIQADFPVSPRSSG